MYIFSNFLFVQKYKFTKSLSRYIIKIYNIYNFACADVSCEEDFTSSFFGEAPPREGNGMHEGWGRMGEKHT